MPEKNFPLAEEVKQALRDALRKFYLNDGYLIHNDVHERTLTFRLGMYLQELFPSWNVDCEYNKNINTLKGNKFLLSRCTYSQKMNCSNCNDRKSCTVFPDIIIHRRCTSQNLLVIEAKKNAAPTDRHNDTAKVKEYLTESTLNYYYGIFLDFKDSYEKTIAFLDSNWYSKENQECRNPQETGEMGYEI
ncbi:MAG: hypothetical protein PHI85_07460 [Victivallaceae bacterium]|nr:hypothetical protein [Victivallaceae bacterium]